MEREGGQEDGRSYRRGREGDWRQRNGKELREGAGLIRRDGKEVKKGV